MTDIAAILDEPEIKTDVIDVLAEFFQDSYRDDPHAVSEWLAQGGTSADLFIDLVAALRKRD